MNCFYIRTRSLDCPRYIHCTGGWKSKTSLSQKSRSNVLIWNDWKIIYVIKTCKCQKSIYLLQPCLQLCIWQHPDKYYLRVCYYHALSVNADHFYYAELSYIISALLCLRTRITAALRLPPAKLWMGAALWGPGPELIKSSGRSSPPPHMAASWSQPQIRLLGTGMNAHQDT